ncbi:MAG: TonB-dependent receptor [Bdellovibrionales bacterium]|nr:TonB-dependent receptor [Bdellovibrionales bacterium]
MERGLFVFLFFIANISLANDPPVYSQPSTIVTPKEDSFSKRARDWPSIKKEPSKVSASTNPYRSLKNETEILTTDPISGANPLLLIRGNQSATRTQFLVNDHPITSADGLGPNTLLIPTENLESIRIQEGPQSHSFGENSIGGNIDFDLKKLSRAKATVGTASFGERSIGVGAPIKSDNHHYDLSYSHKDIDGDYEYKLKRTDQAGNRKYNNTHRDQIAAKGESHLGHNLIEPIFLMGRETGAIPGSVDGNPNNKSYSAYLGGLKWTRPLFNDTIFSSRTTYADSLYSTRDFGNDDSDVSRSQFVRQSLLVDVPILGDLKSEWTVDVNHENYRSDFYEDKNLYSTSEDIAGRVSYSFFTNTLFSIGSGYSADFGEFTPSAILKWERVHSAWLAYSEGFRNPPLSSRYGKSDFFEGNEDLKPERSRQVEVGSQFNFGDAQNAFESSSNISAKAFHIYYEDLIQSELNEDSKYEPQNVRSAESYGFTIAADFRFKVTTLGASLTQSENKNLEEGANLMASPNTVWSVYLQQLWGPISFKLIQNQWSSYYLNSGAHEYSDGWVTTDFEISTFAISDWEFAAGVDNIFNNPREVVLGYPESQRRYFAQLTRWF